MHHVSCACIMHHAPYIVHHAHASDAADASCACIMHHASCACIMHHASYIMISCAAMMPSGTSLTRMAPMARMCLVPVVDVCPFVRIWKDVQIIFEIVWQCTPCKLAIDGNDLKEASMCTCTVLVGCVNNHRAVWHRIRCIFTWQVCLATGVRLQLDHFGTTPY